MDELFSKRLTELIKNSKYLLSDMEEAVGKKAATISRYASGEITGVKRSTIVKLANFFGVNPAWLAGLSEDKFSQVDIKPKQTLPILGTVRAGYNHLADENIIGHVTVDREFSDYDNYYALKIIGDSMEPVLYEGDIVIVHRQSDIENGQIGVVLLNGDEATIKKIKKHNGFIELIPFNHNYDSIILTDKDNFLLLGKIIEARITKVFE